MQIFLSANISKCSNTDLAWWDEEIRVLIKTFLKYLFNILQFGRNFRNSYFLV